MTIRLILSLAHEMIRIIVSLLEQREIAFQ